MAKPSRHPILDQLRHEVRWQRDPDVVATLEELDLSTGRILRRTALITAVLFGALIAAAIWL